MLSKAVQHGASGHVLEGGLQVKSDQNAVLVRFSEVLDGLDHLVGSILAAHACCGGPAAAMTEGLLDAMTALSASRRKKDIMRSGRCPPVGLPSGVTSPARRC